MNDKYHRISPNVRRVTLYNDAITESADKWRLNLYRNLYLVLRTSSFIVKRRSFELYNTLRPAQQFGIVQNGRDHIPNNALVNYSRNITKMERYRWVFEVNGKLHTAGYCVSVWQITLSNKQLLAFSSSLIAIAKNGQSNVPLGEPRYVMNDSLNS